MLPSFYDHGTKVPSAVPAQYRDADLKTSQDPLALGGKFDILNPGYYREISGSSRDTKWNFRSGNAKVRPGRASVDAVSSTRAVPKVEAQRSASNTEGHYHLRNPPVFVTPQGRDGRTRQSRASEGSTVPDLPVLNHTISRDQKKSSGISTSQSKKAAQPSRGRQSNRQSGLAHGDGRAVRIGPHQKPVPVSDLKTLKLEFDKADETGEGLVTWAKFAATGGVQGLGSVFSNKTLQSRSNQRMLRRASMADRMYDGVLKFADMLRILYPEASPVEIERMDTIAKEISGEKMRPQQYPRARREAAQEQYRQIAEKDGEVYLDNLEDLLLEEYPDSNHYELLKMLKPAVFNGLYDRKPIPLEDFMLWYLQLEDMAAPRQKGSSKPRRSRVERKMDYTSVLGSYISRRGAGNAF